MPSKDSKGEFSRPIIKIPKVEGRKKILDSITDEALHKELEFQLTHLESQIELSSSPTVMPIPKTELFVIQDWYETFKKILHENEAKIPPEVFQELDCYLREVKSRYLKKIEREVKKREMERQILEAQGLRKLNM